MATTSFGGTPAPFPLVFLPLHVPTYLRPKDFERFCWPTFCRLVNDLAGMGTKCLLFLEGDWDPHFSFLAQLPKGHLVGMLEREIVEAKKAIGDTMCLAGGLDADLLGYGTPDKCVAQAKAVESCAPGGCVAILSATACENRTSLYCRRRSGETLSLAWIKSWWVSFSDPEMVRISSISS